MTKTVRRDVFCGVDLGQKQDHSTIVVIEREVQTWYSRNPVTFNNDRHDEVMLVVTMAERIALGTPYLEVSRRVAAVARECGSRGGRSLLAVDTTGVGAAVLEMLRQESLGKTYLLPVLITDGDREQCVNGQWRVPKKDLVAVVTGRLERRELGVAAGVRASELVEEMRGFGVKVKGGGGERYEGKRDDLVIGLCLAVWAAGLADYGERAEVRLC